MNNTPGFLKSSLLVAMTLISSACIVAEPREGYYDRDHARYYHEHGWHECGERNEACR